MTVNSKELDTSIKPQQQQQNDGIFSLLYSIFKKVVIVGSVYFIGYMGWSFGWLVAPIIFAVTRDQWREKANRKRDIAKISALANEKDVILARIHDLPAWVSNKKKTQNLNYVYTKHNLLMK